MYSRRMGFASFVVKDLAVAGLPAGGATVTNINLPKGAAVLVDKLGKRLTTMPTTGVARFAYSRGTNQPLIFTQLFDVTKLVLTKQKFIADTEQVTTLGYQGSGTANLPTDNNSSFGIYVRQEQDDYVYGGNASMPIHMQGQFSTSASSNAREFALRAADAIFTSVNNWVSETSNSKPSYLRLRIITDGTVGAPIAGGAIVINGSKTIVMNSGIGTIAVGDTISVGSTTDAYSVAAVSGLTVTLGEKFRGPNATAETVNEITTVGGLYGLQFTGIANEFDPFLFSDYSKNSFSVIIQKQGAPVSITHTTTQSKFGVGNYELVALEEKAFMENNDGATLTTFIPQKQIELFADPAKNYSIVDVKWTHGVDAETPLGTLGKTFGNVRFLLELTGTALAASTVGDALAETILGTAYATGDL